MFHNTIHRYAVCALAIVLSHTSMASVINGSFEAETHGLMPNGVSTSMHEEWGMPEHWAWRNSGATNGHGMRADYAPFGNQLGWSSDGDWSLYVFASTLDRHEPGNFLEFYQTVDLTGQSLLLFDSLLKGGTFTNSYLAIDAQKLWVENLAGNYQDVVIDVSTFSGTHEIRIGVEVFQPFDASADGLTYFDNIRLVPEPGTLLMLMLALGTLVLTRQQGLSNYISQFLKS